MLPDTTNITFKDEYSFNEMVQMHKSIMNNPNSNFSSDLDWHDRKITIHFGGVTTSFAEKVLQGLHMTKNKSDHEFTPSDLLSVRRTRCDNGLFTITLYEKLK